MVRNHHLSQAHQGHQLGRRNHKTANKIGTPHQAAPRATRNGQSLSCSWMYMPSTWAFSMTGWPATPLNYDTTMQHHWSEHERDQLLGSRWQPYAYQWTGYSQCKPAVGQHQTCRHGEGSEMSSTLSQASCRPTNLHCLCTSWEPSQACYSSCTLLLVLCHSTQLPPTHMCTSLVAWRNHGMLVQCRPAEAVDHRSTW